MKKPFIFTLLFLTITLFSTSGCAWIVTIMTAKEMENYDNTVTDQDITQLEKERNMRMLKNESYRNTEINAVNERSSLSSDSQTKSLSLKELKEQQELERARRARESK